MFVSIPGKERACEQSVVGQIYGQAASRNVRQLNSSFSDIYPSLAFPPSPNPLFPISHSSLTPLNVP